MGEEGLSLRSTLFIHHPREKATLLKQNNTDNQQLKNIPFRSWSSLLKQIQYQASEWVRVCVCVWCVCVCQRTCGVQVQNVLMRGIPPRSDANQGRGLGRDAAGRRGLRSSIWLQLQSPAERESVGWSVLSVFTVIVGRSAMGSD